MSRIETSNTWEEGLVMDLNPLSTPNSVLTDCVNGTFITYNGNEFSLQNDQGNYKLEYCRLSPNYIPVGIKEYGDILYIVSQNPLDNSVEIGSYPSPLMITVPDEKNNENDFESIIESQILDQNLTEGNYTELMESASNIIFNGDDYKLNPGDEYCLQTEGNDFPYKYETIEYSILDEDSNVHNITEKIKVDKNGDPKDFEHVAWTVPGWLSIKARLAELSVAGINIRSFYVPKNNDVVKTAHFAFNLRLNINDKYLINNGHLQDWCNGITDLQDVRFRVFIEKEVGSTFESIYDEDYVEFAISDMSSSKNKSSIVPDNFFLNEYDWTEWYGDSRVLWKNISGKIEGLDSNDKIRVRMIPVLYEEEYNYKIIYNNLEQSLLFDLAAVEDEEWNIGTELYQFYLSSDKNTQYIYTNVSGPMISSFPVNLYGDIYDIDGKPIISGYVFEDYSGIGENVLQIPFNDDFKSENIYVIQFKFAPSVNEIGNFPTVTRFLITSEVFNDFTNVMIYDKDIKFDEWIKRYWAHNKTEFELNYKEIDTKTEISYVDEVIYENDLDGNVPTESDIKYQKGNLYNTFFSDENSGLSESIKYRKGFKYNFDYNTKITEKPLEGDLWNGFDPINKLMRMDYSNNTKVDFEAFESKDPENPIYNRTNVSAYLELLCKYHKMGIPFDFSNTQIWYLSDNLKDLSSYHNSGYLTDYCYDVDIFVYGRKLEIEGEENKTITVKGELKNKGVVEDEFHFLQRLSGSAIESGKDNKHAVLINNEIYKALSYKKLPCLLVKVNYTLSGSSSNFELLQTICGGPHSGPLYGDFTFHKDFDTDFVLYYIAFLETDKDIPVLIPLTSNLDGVAYFNTFCKNISIVIGESAYLKPYDRYILNLESVTNFDPRLTIYNRGQFTNLVYESYDLSDPKIRLSIINKLKSIDLDIQNATILLETSDLISKAMSDDTFVVFDKVLAKVIFNTNEYPYISYNGMHGVNEIRSILNKLASKAESDFDKWSNSPQLNAGNNMIEGVYCDGLIGTNDALISEMSNGIKDLPYIRLTAKNYDGEAGITEDAVASKWKNKDDDKVLNEQFRNKASWYVWHNPENWGAEVDHHILLGGCLSKVPDIRLDLDWSWLRK